MLHLVVRDFAQVYMEMLISYYKTMSNGVDTVHAVPADFSL